jgi:uncharacterized phage protein (TIGR02220 family)
MHYFKRNIGDYAKKAGRLSMLQHGAYTLLIDSCYDREVFPTMDEAIDWTWSSSKEEVEAVEFVLKKFFTLESDGTYTQKRIKEDVDKYHQTAEINKKIAAEREEKRRAAKEQKEEEENEASTKRERRVNEAPDNLDESTKGSNEAPPNQEPLTTNQEPLNQGPKDQKNMPSKLDAGKEVIDYLNHKTGSNYQPVPSNTKLVLDRIKEGRTVGEIKAVIDRQCLEWPPGHKQYKYLRPATLFNATKFNNYFGQLGQPITLEQQNGKSKSAYQQRIESGDERSFNIDTNF